MEESRLIPLNIVLTYPVHWSKIKVLIDFIQNFYDACGHENWKKEFKWSFENGELKIFLDNHGFSYEWLLHIGASTKTDSEDSQAGYFGEGFKIASLCAYRDFGWHIKMESADWVLNVTEINSDIDRKNVKILSYEKTNREYNNSSTLTLSGLHCDDIELFENALSRFFFSENELLGECIWTNGAGALYYRSKKELPKSFPITSPYGKSGIIFCNYQARGTMPFPFVICKHNYANREDRERKTLNDYEVIKVVYQVVEEMDGLAAAIFLNSLKAYWNSYPKKHVDIKTWYYVVCELIRRVSCSEEAMLWFKNKNSKLVFYPRVYSNDSGYIKNRKRLAKSWHKMYLSDYKIVQEKFSILSYDNLEEICEKAGAFLEIAIPDTRQLKYINILEKFTEECFQKFFNESTPDCQIIINDSAAYGGMVKNHKIQRVLKNNYGLKIRYEFNTVYIKKKYLQPAFFQQALSTYLHERAHIFGGDSSASFSLALTLVAEILLKNSDKVSQYKDLWRNIES